MQNIRDEIDDIDNEIVQLLSKRMDLVKELGQLKQSSGTDIQDKARETEILNRLKTLAGEKGLYPDFIDHLYSCIFIESRKLQELKIKS